MKKKILLSAYAISPYRGSEYGAAWNMVMNLAKHNELWVLYGMSDDHMGDTETLKNYIKEKPIPGVTFVEVRARIIANTINRLNKIGLGWFFYFAYYLWQKEALKAAKKIIREVDIDVVHQFGPIGYREPGFLSQLGKPLVWGPIGGMNIISKDLLQNKPFKTRLKFIVKNAINHVQLNYSLRIRRAFQRADVLIAATGSGQQTIREKFNRASYYLPEQGVIGNILLNENKFDAIYDTVQLVWSGKHIDRKNFDLCLDALSLVKQRNWMLHVLGNGPLTPVMQQRATDLGLNDNIIWHGHIERETALKIMADAHLHIITSIAEDNPAVVFEALSAGVPTLTIGHCGMNDVINEQCGIKIKPGEPGQMTRRIAVALEPLLMHPSTLKKLAQTTITCAARHEWSVRLEKLDGLYNEAIALHDQESKSPINSVQLNLLQDA